MAFFRRSPPIVPAGFPAADPDALRAELGRRLAGVQRHRLLQGFPMAPMMGQHDGGYLFHRLATGRPLILGVIPHTFCVPSVRGCGFCTFPHDAFQRSQVWPLARAIAQQIGQRRLAGRSVSAVYFGGGTANLTPVPALAMMLGALWAADLSATELTLEGVPRFFDTDRLDLLASAGVGHGRISMGVQTFDAGWVQRMGRGEIGSESQVVAAVEAARARGLGTSIDLLINLPGQPRAAMVADVRRALELGVDQVCVYHLVLREGLGVPWAEDADLLATLPDNVAAFDNWRAVRALLLEAGLEQRTLTNFARADTSFEYEPLSFRPHTVDALGFGPNAISGVNFGRGGAREEAPMKWVNTRDLLDRQRDPIDRVYVYEPFEDALMQLTRGLALLRVPRDVGALSTHGAAFEPELAVLEEAGLVGLQEDAITLTERGQFYADSVAGLLAWRTVQHRQAVGLNEPARAPMG